MDNNKDLNNNSTDFQGEIYQNIQTDTNYSDIKADNAFAGNPNDLAQSTQDVTAIKESELNYMHNTELSGNTISDNTDDIDSFKQTIADESTSVVAETEIADNSQDTTQDKNCVLDKVKFDKMKNWFFGSIPFIITAIAISLFNIGRVRQPLSFLFLALGLLELSISNLIISNRIAKTCTCKNCTRQSKSSVKHAILYGVGCIGFLGLFIFYMVT